MTWQTYTLYNRLAEEPDPLRSGPGTIQIDRNAITSARPLQGMTPPPGVEVVTVTLSSGERYNIIGPLDPVTP